MRFREIAGLPLPELEKVVKTFSGEKKAFTNMVIISKTTNSAFMRNQVKAQIEINEKFLAKKRSNHAY